MEEPEIRLKRTPFNDNRGSLQYTNQLTPFLLYRGKVTNICKINTTTYKYLSLSHDREGRGLTGWYIVFFKGNSGTDDTQSMKRGFN